MQTITTGSASADLKAAVSIIIAHQMADTILKANAENASFSVARNLLSGAGFGARSIDALIESARLIASTVTSTAH